MKIAYYRQKLQRRMLLLCLGMLGLIAAMVVPYLFGQRIESEHFRGFVAGLQSGLTFFFLVVGIVTFFQYRKALKNEEALETLYIRENDERSRMINDKIGGMAYNILLWAMVVATVVAGYFNETVCFTLLAVTYVTTFLKAGMKIYYRKKL